MQAPEQIRVIANECAAEHMSDIDGAVACCLERVRDAPRYDEWVLSLVEQCCRELVYEARHAANVQMKRRARQYGAGARTPPSAETVAVTIHSLFNYRIDSRRLGDLRFSELERVADREERIGNGHFFNARLCRALYHMRPRRGDPTVEERVREEQLQSLFRELDPPPEAGTGLADAGD